MKTFLEWCVIMAVVLALLAAGTYGMLVLVERMDRPYVETCRAAGGVPVNTGRGGLNCATKDGGWIDVRR